MSLIINLTTEERLEVAEGVDHMDILGTSTPGKRNSEGKGLRAGICLIYSRNLKEPKQLE